MRGGALGLVCILTLAACGGGGADPDAGDGDGDGDAAQSDADPALADAAPFPDAAPGPVLVRVLDDAGDPLPGVTVVFHQADGAVLAEETTDAAGEAGYTDPPGGAMATILTESGSTPQLRIQTIVGIEGGDVIVVGTPAAPVEPTLDVRVDYPGSFGAADIYLADLGCEFFGVANPDLIVTTAVGERCLGSDDDFDVLAVARDNPSTHLAYATLRDVAQAGSGPTDLVLPSWVAAETRAVGFGALPLEITDVDVDLRPVLDGLTRWPLLLVGGPDDTFTAPDEALVDGWYVRAGAQAFSGNDARSWSWRQVLAANIADPYELDFADFGPRFDTLDLDRADEVHPAITWTSSASTASYGAIAVVATWYDAATSPQGGHRWTVVLPPGSTSATLPTLPDSASLYRPAATAEYQYLQVFALWFARHADYRAFRNEQPFELGAPIADNRAEEARVLLYQKDVSP
jgi:hypothetical protein